MITNPNKPLRAAYIAALTPIGIPVKSKKMPKSSGGVQQYIIISSQTKQRTEVSKKCFEWLCSIVIDINYFDPSGYANADLNDDIEEQVIDIIQTGFDVSGFYVKSIDFVQSQDLDLETATFSILRKVITYQHWLCQHNEILIP